MACLAENALARRYVAPTRRSLSTPRRFIGLDIYLSPLAYISHSSEYSQAVDYVSRALYAYERAFLGAFSFTSGNNRLDFDRVENRPFFLAIHRQVM